MEAAWEPATRPIHCSDLWTEENLEEHRNRHLLSQTHRNAAGRTGGRTLETLLRRTSGTWTIAAHHWHSQLNMPKATSFTLDTSAGLPEDLRLRRPPHPTIPTTRTGTASKATSFTFAGMPGWGSGNDQQTRAGGRGKDLAFP